MIAVMAAGCCLSVLDDVLLLRGTWLFAAALATKLLCLVASAVAYVRARSPRRHDQAVTLALFATAILSVACSLTRLQSGEVEEPLLSQGVMLCLLYFWLRGPLRRRAITAGVIVAASLVALWSPRAAVSRAAQPAGALMFFALNVVGVASARSAERERRALFEAERRGRHAQQRLAIKLRELEAERERARAPRASEAPARSPGPALRPEARPALQILVAAEAADRAATVAVFSELGRPVDRADSGPKAVEMAERKGYDVIFVDLLTPEVSALEATEQLRKSLPAARSPLFVALTDTLSPEDREAWRRAGMFDVLAKPIDAAALSDVLARAAAARAPARPEEPASEQGVRLDGLARLERVCQPDLILSLCHLFLTEAPRRAELIQSRHAAYMKEGEELERLAHNLKSAAATLGAASLSRLSGELERAARQGRPSALGDLIAELVEELPRVERAVRAEIERRTGAAEAP